MDIKNSSAQAKYNDRPSDDIEKIIAEIKKAFYKKDNDLLNVKINNIKSAFFTNWEKDNIPFIENLIKNINIETGIPLPILSICGKGTQEVRFTKYLSYFLDSKKKHGLQDKLLQTLLNPECLLSELGSGWSKGCTVIPEINLGEIYGDNKKISSYADIGIEGENFIIIIEQKILSGESNHSDSDLTQLERYNIALDNNPKYMNKKKIKIYLTPNKSYKDPYGWLSLSHDELIDRAINLLKDNHISKTGKDNLVRLLFDLAVGPYEIVEDSLDEVIFLGNTLIKHGFNLGRFIRFKKLLEENKKIIEILSEV